MKIHYAQYLDIGKPVQTLISDLETLRNRLKKAEADASLYQIEIYKKEIEINKMIYENFSPEEVLRAKIKQMEEKYKL